MRGVEDMLISRLLHMATTQRNYRIGGLRREEIFVALLPPDNAGNDSPKAQHDGRKAGKSGLISTNSGHFVAKNTAKQRHFRVF